MKIFFNSDTGFAGFEKAITALKDNGFKTIMAFHAEGGIDQDPAYKKKCDILLKKMFSQGIRIFGGIFPGLIDNGKLVDRGSMVVGMDCRTRVITLERLGDPDLGRTIEKALTRPDKENPPFKTLFVFGDGFGESNLNLIRGLNHIARKFPVNVLGGLAGRNSLKASHYNVFTPEKAILNGAVLAFTDLESGIGVNHGWTPLPQSQCAITRTNHCYVETINNQPALEFYLDLICRIDPAVARRKQALLSGDADLLFKEAAVKYPLGLIRKQKEGQLVIDRTAVSVGADHSLQFSAEIPKGTQACILHLTGKTPKAMCLNIREAAQNAYIESIRLFPTDIPDPRVIIMDCFGRKQFVDTLGFNYESIEFDIIAADQKNKDHSPIGVLTFGEISSMETGEVELHNKTAVVATVEDR